MSHVGVDVDDSGESHLEVKAVEVEGDISPSIKALYGSLGIDEKEATSSVTYRLNVIHVRGVNEMSTDDILDYFKDLGCTSVEWINDYSCNAVWPDAGLAAKAMLSVIKEVKISQTTNQTVFPPHVSDTNDNDIVMVEDEDSEDDGIALTDDEDLKQKNKDDEKPKEIPQETVTETDVKTLGIPVPPGRWRLGIPHEKSQAILMRFALKADKKLPGAEKRSQYYQKYGNPNYGGMVGLISKSKKRKYRDVRWKDDKIHPLQTKEYVQNDDNQLSGEDSDEYIPSLVKTRRLYADEEEERRAKERSRAVSPKRNVSDLRNKLGRSGRVTSSHRSGRETHDELHSSKYRSHHRFTDRSSSDLRSKLKNKSSSASYEETEEIGDLPSMEPRGESEVRRGSDLRRKLNRLREDKKWKDRSPLVVELLADNSN